MLSWQAAGPSGGPGDLVSSFETTDLKKFQFFSGLNFVLESGLRAPFVFRKVLGLCECSPGRKIGPMRA